MRESITKSDKGPNLSVPWHEMEEKRYVSPSKKIRSIEKLKKKKFSL